MKIACIFPGYDSQYVGMGKDLYDEYRIVQEYFEEASNCLNINFVKLCFASSDNELRKLVNAYTSLFLVGCSSYAILQELGIQPDVVLGYNNGGYGAAWASACFSFPDGLYLINKFCSFYQPFIDESAFDARHIIGCDTTVLEELCKKVSTEDSKVFIAIYNQQKDHVVAGHRTALEELENVFDKEITIKSMGAEIGLHSLLMDYVTSLFKSYLEKVDFKDLKIPLISGLDGALVKDGEEVKRRLINAISSPVNFIEVIKKLKKYDCIIIAAPGDGLAKLIRETYKDKVIISIAKKLDIDKLKEMIRIEQEQNMQDK